MPTQQKVTKVWIYKYMCHSSNFYELVYFLQWKVETRQMEKCLFAMERLSLFASDTLYHAIHCVKISWKKISYSNVIQIQMNGENGVNETMEVTNNTNFVYN